MTETAADAAIEPDAHGCVDAVRADGQDSLEVGPLGWRLFRARWRGIVERRPAIVIALGPIVRANPASRCAPDMKTRRSPSDRRAERASYG